MKHVVIDARHDDRHNVRWFDARRAQSFMRRAYTLTEPNPIMRVARKFNAGNASRALSSAHHTVSQAQHTSLAWRFLTYA
ncbi:hypothetical protein A9762_15720 [Pandoraea sp. ISTKB]|nr:hypothetical protein A9762_15720 [Pandoraea sp. ISTKB]